MENRDGDGCRGEQRQTAAGQGDVARRAWHAQVVHGRVEGGSTPTEGAEHPDRLHRGTTQVGAGQEPPRVEDVGGDVDGGASAEQEERRRSPARYEEEQG